MANIDVGANSQDIGVALVCVLLCGFERVQLDYSYKCFSVIVTESTYNYTSHTSVWGYINGNFYGLVLFLVHFGMSTCGVVGDPVSDYRPGLESSCCRSADSFSPR